MHESVCKVLKPLDNHIHPAMSLPLSSLQPVSSQTISVRFGSGGTDTNTVLRLAERSVADKKRGAADARSAAVCELAAAPGRQLFRRRFHAAAG